MPQALPSLTELIAGRRGGAPLIGAHRGGATDAPENTLAAFGEGIGRGADILELEVHLSRDRELVVIHDHDLTLTEAPSPVAGWDLARNGVSILGTDEADAIEAATRPGVPRPAGSPS